MESTVVEEKNNGVSTQIAGDKDDVVSMELPAPPAWKKLEEALNDCMSSYCEEGQHGFEEGFRIVIVDEDG